MDIYLTLLANADDSSSNAGAGILNIAILLLIPVGMYFLLIRPQRRRRNEQMTLQKSIGVGDEVMTTAGIYGFVTAMEEGSDVVWLEIDNDVQIRVTRAAIANKVLAATPAATGTDTATPATTAEPATPAADATAAPAAPVAPPPAKTPTLKGGRDTTSTPSDTEPTAE